MHSRNYSRSLASALTALVLLSGVAIAADTARAVPPEPSAEMRAKMAAVHEQMGACLRSDRPINDCRAEMMKECHELMGEHACPMMEMGKHGHMMKSSMSPPPKEQ